MKHKIVSATLDKLSALPFETTSSMQRDFKKGNGKTELETITGYVVRQGKEPGLPIPVFRTAYDKLISLLHK